MRGASSTAASPSAAWNSRLAELTQYLSPVGLGPSSKTWPRCAPHSAQETSVRIRLGSAIIRKRFPPTPEASFLSRIFFLSMMSKKDGQPEPESYLEALEKCWMLQTTQV